MKWFTALLAWLSDLRVSLVFEIRKTSTQAQKSLRSAKSEQFDKYFKKGGK